MSMNELAPKAMPPLLAAIEHLNCVVDGLTERVSGIREVLQINYPVAPEKDKPDSPALGLIGIRTSSVNMIAGRIEELFEDLEHIRRVLDEI